MKFPTKKQAATNPIDFPVEVVMLFERAAYNPIRVPEAGKGFDTFNKALSAKLVMAKWKASMYRHPETPRAWQALLSTIQFANPVKEENGWAFYIRPLTAGEGTIGLAKAIIGETDVKHDEFWQTYVSIPSKEQL